MRDEKQVCQVYLTEGIHLYSEVSNTVICKHCTISVCLTEGIHLYSEVSNTVICKHCAISVCFTKAFAQNLCFTEAVVQNFNIIICPHLRLQ